MPRMNDITGKVFGRLTATSVAFTHKARGRYWECSCICGGTVIVCLGNLTSGNTKSCGCWKLEKLVARSTTHGESHKSPEYDIWAQIIQRCRNPKNKAYANYGGRGINVCERWLSFDEFLRDMGRRPSSAHSIDRIDNDDGYRHGNCRWATLSEQARNKRSSAVIDTPNGPMLLCEAAEVSGIPVDVLWKRARRGWPASRMFNPLGDYT